MVAAAMADDLSLRGAEERSRVNLNDPHDLRHWARRFGCTEEQLREAVERVGVTALDVESDLRAQGSKPPPAPR